MRATARKPDTVVDRDLRADRDCGTACPAEHPRRARLRSGRAKRYGLISAVRWPADALIASTYLAGTNTRRVRRALAALLGGAVGKDTVSRTWRKVKSDWDAWNTRSLAEEPAVLASFSTARWCARGSTARRLPSRCSSSSVCADGRQKGRAGDHEHERGRAPRLGAPSSTISSRAACVGPSFSSSMARLGSTGAIAAVWDGVPGAALHDP